jgi:hypothetical protein
MAIEPQDQEQVTRFLSYISTIDADKNDAGFAYLALRDGERFVLGQARVLLNHGTITTTEIQTKNVRAGYVRLSEMQRDPAALLTDLANGTVTTPQGSLTFCSTGSGAYNARYQAIRAEGQPHSVRLSTLRITGGDRFWQLRTPELDWELKAHALPYDGIDDLAASLAIGPLSVGPDHVEFAALPIVRIKYDWNYRDGAALVELVAFEGIDQAKVSLTFRKFRNRQVVERGSLGSNTISWSFREGILHGQTSIQIEPDAQLHCVACYAGVAQHFGWIVDPGTVANPRMVAFNAYDGELVQLRTLLSRTGRGGNARDFEAGVSWLLWMLGFGTAHLGNVGVFQDGPDIIATSASGHMAVVECTTGMLRTDNKLPALIARTEVVRRSLQDAGNPSPRLLAVMFTSRTREEIKAELPEAVKHSVYVVARESLDSLLTQAGAYPNSDALYEQAEKAVQDAGASLTEGNVEVLNTKVELG